MNSLRWGADQWCIYGFRYVFTYLYFHSTYVHSTYYVLRTASCVCVLGKLVAQSCLTLCDPIACSPQAPLSMGFPARILEWVTISFFPAQGSNPRFLNWQADSLPLSHQGSPDLVGIYLQTWPFETFFLKVVVFSCYHCKNYNPANNYEIAVMYVSDITSQTKLL